MGGNGTNAGGGGHGGDELPEKTLAMQSPTFAEGERPPSPISVPPSAAAQPPTAPVPFPPSGSGGKVPPRASPGVPRVGPAGSPSGPGGLRRPQTVLGLAPPPAGGRGPETAPAPTRPQGASSAAAPTAPAKAAPEPDAFGLDDALGDAARAAIGPGTRRSPLASTGFAGQKPPYARGGPKPFDRTMSSAEAGPPTRPAPLGGIPDLGVPLEEDESTRAVSREELLRADPEHVIVGSDTGAASQESTLAVSADQNPASRNFTPAMAASVLGDDPSLPTSSRAFAGQHSSPNPPVFGSTVALGAPGQPHGAGAPQAFAQQQGFAQQPWQDPPQQPWQDPQQQPWQDPQQQPQGQWKDPNASFSPQQQPQGQWQDPNASFSPQQQWQDPNASFSPQQASHAPSMPHPHYPSGQMQAMPPSNMTPSAPMAYGSMGPYPPQNQPPSAPWANASPKEPIRLSGQLILLAVVGIVCLAIFITGIVLFVTTKFN